MMIRDEIHGTIEFTEIEEKIIDSPDFQRLRRIKQMSVSNLVYPGANHTRFEHSLGTSHLAHVISTKLGLEEEIIEKIRLYALIHDIGHVAFSHEGEDVLKKYLGNHEELRRIKLSKGELTDIISENYSSSDILEIGDSSFGAIVDSDLGADRMDYLKRDALNTGVAYGIVDIDRIVHTMVMKNGKLAISHGGLEAAEYLLIARFMMFSAVYMHKTVRIATAMLYRAIKNTLSDGLLCPEDFTQLGDDHALALMCKSKSGGSYANAILNRQLYKEVFSMPKKDWNIKKAAQLECYLSEKIGQEIIVDFPNQFFKPIELNVETDFGLMPIVELSKLVDSLKKTEQGRVPILVLMDQKFALKNTTKVAKLIDGFA